ncbi:MAG: pyruvate kinase alpha/beta domain-containing protein, partial [Promethearchaeota archaeon]
MPTGPQAQLAVPAMLPNHGILGSRIADWGLIPSSPAAYLNAKIHPCPLGRVFSQFSIKTSKTPVRTMKVSITYFEEKGAKNTDQTLRLAYQRARKLGISHVIIPTTSGATAVKALKIMKNVNLVVVTHMSGFTQPGQNQLLSEHRKTLKENKVPILTASHVLSGVERGIRNKFDII